MDRFGSSFPRVIYLAARWVGMSLAVGSDHAGLSWETEVRDDPESAALAVRNWAGVNRSEFDGNQ